MSADNIESKGTNTPPQTDGGSGSIKQYITPEPRRGPVVQRTKARDAIHHTHTSEEQQSEWTMTTPTTVTHD